MIVCANVAFRSELFKQTVFCKEDKMSMFCSTMTICCCYQVFLQMATSPLQNVDIPVGISSMSFVIYQYSSLMVLSMVSPTEHAALNMVKRILIIFVAVCFDYNKLTTNNIICTVINIMCVVSFYCNKRHVRISMPLSVIVEAASLSVVGLKKYI